MYIAGLAAKGQRGWIHADLLIARILRLPVPLCPLAFAPSLVGGLQSLAVLVPRAITSTLGGDHRLLLSSFRSPPRVPFTLRRRFALQARNRT